MCCTNPFYALHNSNLCVASIHLLLCRDLEELWLDGFAGLHTPPPADEQAPLPSVLNVLVPLAPTLRHLSLCGCKRLRRQDLRSVAKLTSLTYLNLEGASFSPYSRKS